MAMFLQAKERTDEVDDVLQADEELYRHHMMTSRSFFFQNILFFKFIPLMSIKEIFCY